jgi:NTP pyrophosphatase (non-canonical NTP hydrolase)
MTKMNSITAEDVEQFDFLNRHSVEFNSLDRYQEIATGSAIYPGQGTPLGLAYVALKMNGEAGEFAEHVGKAMRDDDLIPSTWDFEAGDMLSNHGTLTPERRTLLIKEIGDVLWYLSAACNELGISLSDAATVNLNKLLDRTERDTLRGSGDER